jgi:hypothetical protein
MIIVPIYIEDCEGAGKEFADNVIQNGQRYALLAAEVLVAHDFLPSFAHSFPLNFSLLI